jgi:hypothetical protein
MRAEALRSGAGECATAHPPACVPTSEILHYSA